MSLFKPATNELAFSKIGIQGFAGSGKTRTAIEIAFGLHKHTGSQFPVYMFDTEHGSDFYVAMAKERGVPFLVTKTRSFKDLKDGLHEAKKANAITIVDSVTHFWEDVIASYKRRRNIKRMAVWDWDAPKTEWREGFAEPFVLLPIHMIVCGRAAFEYEETKDDSGKKEIFKTGTKMRTESQFGYEPSLCLELVPIKKSAITHDLNDKEVIHRCYILKDRNPGPTSMDGGEIDNPTFDSFLPHFACLNIGGEHHAFASERNSDELFDEDGERRQAKARRQKQILLEEFKNILDSEWSGSSDKAKTKRREVFAEVCSFLEMKTTQSWTAFESLTLRDIQRGHIRLVELINDDRREDLRDDLMPIPEYLGVNVFGEDGQNREDK